MGTSLVSDKNTLLSADALKYKIDKCFFAKVVNGSHLKSSS